MLLDGKLLANIIESDLEIAVQYLKKNNALIPGIALLSLEHKPENDRMINMKYKRAKKIGINAKIFDTNVIDHCNKNSEYHGILLQLPVKKQYAHLIHNIVYEKDIDGLSYLHRGRLIANEQPFFIPPTPLGCLWLLKREHPRPLNQERILVIGRSPLVGRPLAELLINANATVTLAHSYTKNINQLVTYANVIISATGQSDIIDPKFCLPDVTILDVGLFIGKNGKLRGDMPSNAVHHAARITLVPGGIGPLTIAALLFNTVKAAYNQQNIPLHPKLKYWENLIFS